jgi:diadenosine tetraphosphate (Ap4A) HIT family hydrolase
MKTVESDNEDGDLMNGDTLSEGEEGSSYGGGSQFRPPTLATLIELGHPQCQALTQVTATDGANVVCICGRSAGDCQQHATHHISGLWMVTLHLIGFYGSMPDEVRGFQGHGCIGTFYVQEQVEELCHQDLEEMENLIAGMEDAFTIMKMGK